MGWREADLACMRGTEDPPQSHPFQRKCFGSGSLAAVPCKILGSQVKDLFCLRNCDHLCNRQALKACRRALCFGLFLLRTDGCLCVSFRARLRTGTLPRAGAPGICWLLSPHTQLCWLMSGLDRCLLNEHLSRSQETKVQSSPSCVTLVK